MNTSDESGHRSVWASPGRQGGDDRPPLWLLDVDGVLNAVNDRLDPNVWPDWETVQSGWFTVRFARSVTRFVRRMHETGAAEVCWLTTWEHDANRKLGQPLDLPEFAVAGLRPNVLPADPPGPPPLVDQAAMAPFAAADTVTRDWWKWHVVQAIHAADPTRRIIWADDDLSFEPEVIEWMTTNTSCLLVSPSTYVGLTRDDLAAIADFCGVPALDAPVD